MRRDEIQAIFWDFDGVIVDSVAIKNQAFKKLFQPFGDEVVEQVLAHHTSHGGISRVEKIDHYYKTILSNPLSTEALEEQCVRFSNLVIDEVVKVEYIPGALEFLEQYSPMIDMFVISGTPWEELDEIITRRGLKRYFKEILGSPTRKPVHVDRLIQDNAFRRDACIFIGDAMTDYHTARQTNIPFIGIQGAVTFPEGTTVIPNCLTLRETIEKL